MLSLLTRVAGGSLRSLGRSPFSSLAPWWGAAVRRAPPLWCGAAAPRASLLALSPPPGLLLLPPPPVLFAGLKTKTSLKRRCKDCFIVRRRGRLYVLCKTNPRHKQRKL
ncbi:39S ribosomal protein L36, mitochondrial [Aquila chrysaetos chrysaetos]|uniref:39S ribosomal protein L36, mitochondrial n=1 Tax=Aquila chrysaetos chrysaetos TaxID=223781 RepID=UPI0005D08AFA|nr:39S ribosomal protein L36, mitochondrial [Aquila chrysaetos chrysaetos]XP_040979100.1 39S ribosomal protein L36, mitochondrial [Aquila chrysaetos chrysaetos]